MEILKIKYFRFQISDFSQQRTRDIRHTLSVRRILTPAPGPGLDACIFAFAFDFECKFLTI